MEKRSLGAYVVDVIIALIIVNFIVWYMGRLEEMHSMKLISVDFLLGMLALYIAVHLYRWKLTYPIHGAI